MQLKNSMWLSLVIIFTLCVTGVSQAAENFVLKDMEGKEHHLSQYKGKWVVVNYWATWCPPCLEEVPDLVALYDSRKHKDVMVLGVVFDYENIGEVEAFVDDMLMSYPIVLGDDKVSKQIGSAEALPTTYIYNPQGALVKTKRGLITKQYIESFMAK
jgi:thiol-disulfide isomerase/thioredoxin